jgi:hypothetical protein
MAAAKGYHASEWRSAADPKVLRWREDSPLFCAATSLLTNQRRQRCTYFRLFCLEQSGTDTQATMFLARGE